MKTKFIKCKTLEIKYPVGEYIQYNIEKIVSMASVIEKSFKDQYLNLWCSGSSGAIIAAIIASIVEQPCKICHVEKAGEDAHSSYTLPDSRDINIIVDDFIRSGCTIQRIVRYVTGVKAEIDALFVTSDVPLTSLEEIFKDIKIHPKIIYAESIYHYEYDPKLKKVIDVKKSKDIDLKKLFRKLQLHLTK